MRITNFPAIIEEASLSRQFGTLSNRDVAKQASSIPDGSEENILYRSLKFMSFTGQKVLQHGARPLTLLGLITETGLNALSLPDRSSPKFLSVIGHIDPRTELDNNIKPSNSRYYPMLCAMASKLSYESENVVETTVKDCWQMESLGFFKFYNDFQGKNTTQALIFRDTTDAIVIAFRGTELFNVDDWCTDIDFSWYVNSVMGKVHCGFMKALGLVRSGDWPKEKDDSPAGQELAYYTIRKILREQILNIPNSKTKFIVTGHSLGGALAILFPAVLAFHEETLLLERLEGVYTFGQPRVGDEEFKNFMENHMVRYCFKYLRFVYSNDLIPRLPFDGHMVFLFKHFGTCVYYNSHYEGELLDEEPNRNYFAPLGWIPRTLTAIYELFRSFILPHTEGPEYSESLALRFIRFTGLIMPGIAAHNPQDYVNITRLGPSDIYDKIQEQYLEKLSKRNQLSG